MFQAYIVTCLTSGRRYIGITSVSLRRRWMEHVYDSSTRKLNGLGAAIRKYGKESFTIEPLMCSWTLEGIQEAESLLIQQWSTLAPNGYNLTLGGGGRFGYRPSAESVERSAAKHRGKPCHPNTRLAASNFHKGKSKSDEMRRKLSQARKGKPRSEATKEKLRAYWAARRKSGEFKTERPYAHSRKAASAQIAKIPFPLARHIARVFKPVECEMTA